MVLHHLSEIDQLPPGTDLAVADFKVYGKGNDGDDVEAIVHATLTKSGAISDRLSTVFRHDESVQSACAMSLS